MIQHKLVQRYSKAFFHSSSVQNKLEVVQQDFIFIKKVYKQSPNLEHAFAHNFISIENKKLLLKKVFGDKIDPLTFIFLFFLIHKNRGNLILDLTSEFNFLYIQSKGYIDVNIYSAIELDDLTQQQIIRKLKTMIQEKIIPNFYIDWNLIGGIKIYYKNLQIDASIKGELTRLHKYLMISNINSLN